MRDINGVVWEQRAAGEGCYWMPFCPGGRPVRRVVWSSEGVQLDYSATQADIAYSFSGDATLQDGFVHQFYLKQWGYLHGLYFPLTSYTSGSASIKAAIYRPCYGALNGPWKLAANRTMDNGELQQSIYSISGYSLSGKVQLFRVRPTNTGQPPIWMKPGLYWIYWLPGAAMTANFAGRKIRDYGGTGTQNYARGDRILQVGASQVTVGMRNYNTIDFSTTTFTGSTLPGNNGNGTCASIDLGLDMEVFASA